MCHAASFILTENEVYFSEKHDSHEEIISENKLVADGANGPHILRVEINPVENLMDLTTWKFKIDQDTRPTWFNAEKDEARVRTALKSWWKCRWDAKTKTFSSGGHMDLGSLTSLPARFNKSKIKGTIYLKN